ncbi:uncharacterized protein A1O9_06361 [Exophiala aquamarina CBS 119918]|uniref:Uncharacterized protein n=1 Tax=Exophiala aquamarina CBS 119918 TaxID=1182545 RepID=A0A072PSD9_9EURO|nr:uncharacterized protein A1O9_06361 [Exophiala aquamarina CBS 119918]KEF58435.1 hypothetical protein A1O9_06361 [Exophiala aquamarina CBS 119918]
MPDDDRANSYDEQSQHPPNLPQPRDSLSLSLSHSQESTGSPQRPSYSPVTPTLSQASLGAQDDAPVGLPPSQWMEEPDPLPLSLDENPDAIALRAALSILQIQRQQALRDMRDLDKMKEAALNDPEQFVKDLEHGKLSHSSRTGIENPDSASPEIVPSHQDPSKFGTFPAAQSVVRAPPVEWAKYHIVGEPLDRLHEVQQHYPGFTESSHTPVDAHQPHEIAAPYRPFIDRIDQSQSSSKRPAS